MLQTVAWLSAAFLFFDRFPHNSLRFDRELWGNLSKEISDFSSSAIQEAAIGNKFTLSCIIPIKTIRGRHGVGIWLEDWFNPDSNTPAEKQEDLLGRVRPTLVGEDVVVLNSILTQFAPVNRYR